MSACKTITLLSLLVALTGCTVWEGAEESTGFFKKVFDRNTYSMYHPNIQQGNKINPADFRRLKVGMSKEQVHYLLGSRITHNVFRKNRWDYYYYLISNTGEKEYHRLTLFFDNDHLTNYRASKNLAESRRKLKKKKLKIKASKPEKNHARSAPKN